MITPMMIPLGLVMASAVAMIRVQIRARRVSISSWEDLVARLQPVPADGITFVAREYLDPRREQITTEPPELWERIGGADGLERMRANADVLIALASYAERWNRVESRIVAERMRRDGIALRRAVRGIQLSMYFGIRRARGAFYIHEAASAYYLMRQRLLALYEVSHVGRLSTLSAAA